MDRPRAGRASSASARYYPWKTIEEYLDHRLTKAGLSFAELKQKGIVRGAKQPIYFEEGVEPEFPTPSGKIEFYSTQLRDAGFDPVPKYTRPAPPPAARSACCSAARPCTRSAARSRTRSCTT